MLESIEIYNYNAITKEYINSSYADKSPLEDQVFLIPQNSTTIKPNLSDNYTYYFDERKNKWLEIETEKETIIRDEKNWKLLKLIDQETEAINQLFEVKTSKGIIKLNYSNRTLKLLAMLEEKAYTIPKNLITIDNNLVTLLLLDIEEIATIHRNIILSRKDLHNQFINYLRDIAEGNPVTDIELKITKGI